jgi:hypothetical protein
MRKLHHYLQFSNGVALRSQNLDPSASLGMTIHSWNNHLLPADSFPRLARWHFRVLR